MCKFLQSPAGKGLAGVLLLCGIVAVIWSAKANLGNGEALNFSRDRTYIDATTGKPYSMEVSLGEDMSLPAKSPSGHSGYPAEPCFWNADGTSKSTPDWVLLKTYLGQKGPTFCPVCGRLVVPMNPAPSPGTKPPPTEKEYAHQREMNAFR